MGQPYSAAYCASKGGVVNLTKALADEYLKRGVRVNCIAPGGIETPLQNEFTKLPEGVVVEGIPQGRCRRSATRSPKRSRTSSLFVASDECRYMTGSIVSVDGGLTI